MNIFWRKLLSWKVLDLTESWLLLISICCLCFSFWLFIEVRENIFFKKEWTVVEWKLENYFITWEWSRLAYQNYFAEITGNCQWNFFHTTIRSSILETSLNIYKKIEVYCMNTNDGKILVKSYNLVNNNDIYWGFSLFLWLAIFFGITPFLTIKHFLKNS